MSDTYLKAILVSAVECKLLKKLTIEDQSYKVRITNGFK